MLEETRKMTLWLAWYTDEYGQAIPGWPLHLKMFYASSEDEARESIVQWLIDQGQSAQDLAGLSPSPYALEFSTNQQGSPSCKPQGKRSSRMHTAPPATPFH